MSLLAAVAIAGCYDPEFTDCRVACSSNDDCAPEQVCTGKSLCATPDHALACDESKVVVVVDPSPIVVAGTYAVLLTNRENGCAFGNWQMGDTGNSFDLVIDQVSSTVVAAFQHNMAVWFDAWLGSHLLAGVINGSRVQLTLPGLRFAERADGCSFTFDLVLDVNLVENQLGGVLSYQGRTNGVPACGALTGCITRQQLSGIRAPS